jgi:hypothetical protein
VRIGRYLFLALVPLIPWSQGKIDASLGRYRTQEEVLYLWSGQEVAALFPGFENLMADVYWLRTVQYFGGERAFSTEKKFTLLGPLTEITTTLDPRFEMGYRYGAIFLSETPPMGAGQPEKGLALLRKGVERNPASWRLRWELGANIYFFSNDPRRAAAVLLEASKIPGAPFWLDTVAATLLEKGGERQTARQMWRRMYEQSEGALKSNAEYFLMKLDALDEVDVLKGLIRTFEARAGRWPRSLEELRTAGLLKGRAADPTGVPFEYDPESGSVSIGKSSSLWRSEAAEQLGP